MSKYINADQFERDCMFDRECKDMQDVIYKLRDYPSADVVEVIRCKDCKHCEKIDEYEFWCRGRGYPETMVRPYDFCSSGERKEIE